MPNPSDRAPFEALLIEKAQSDPCFRSSLKENPHEAILAATGHALPPELRISVLEESASRVYLVLPPSDELDDHELAGVTGGRQRLLPALPRKEI